MVIPANFNKIFRMKTIRTVIILDAANLDEVSRFWAAVFKGRVMPEDTWHSVIDSSGEWRMGIQLNPTHVRPQWPDGNQQQQIHLDFHVEDPHESHLELLALGATVLQASESMDTEEGFQVYADPAGHPFCIGWGQPSSAQLAEFLKNH